MISCASAVVAATSSGVRSRARNIAVLVGTRVMDVERKRNIGIGVGVGVEEDDDERVSIDIEVLESGGLRGC